MLFTLLGFGAYLKDAKVNLLQVHQRQIVGGIINLDEANESGIDLYFEKLGELIKPDVVIVLIEQPEIALTTLKGRFPDSDVLFYKLGVNTEKIEHYRLARKLYNIYLKENKRVLVLTGCKWSKNPDQAIRGIQNKTTHRNFIDRKAAGLDKLAIDSKGAVKTLFHFINLNELSSVQVIDSGGSESFIYGSFANVQAGQEDDASYVTLLAFGDIMLDRQVRSFMDANGMYYPFEKIAGPESHFMEGFDFIFANLEGPIKETYVPTSKSIAFRFKPDVVHEIKKTGINVLSIANNHALDQGWGGRSDTMKFLDEARLAYFGHPKNLLEENVHYSTAGGKKIAFIGFDDTIFRIDPEIVNGYIRDLDSENDYVIVSVHWGVEYVHTPTARKVDLAHQFVDNGADLILGHHPHVVQTMEIYNGVPVFYSLGNFVFDQNFSVDTQEGLSVGIVMDDDKTSIYLFPFKIPKSQPTLMNGEEKKKFLEKFVSWKEYDEDMKAAILNGVITVDKYKE